MDGTRIPGAYYWSQEDLVRHYQYLWALHPALRQQVCDQELALLGFCKGL